MADKRVAPRRITCFAVGVEVKNKQAQVGLIRDASTSGALLFTRRPIVTGEEVTISIRLATASSGVDVLAQVVRVERLKEGVWLYAVAVRFSPARADLTQLFEALAQQQERLFGPPLPVRMERR